MVWPMWKRVACGACICVVLLSMACFLAYPPSPMVTLAGCIAAVVWFAMGPPMPRRGEF